MTDLDQTAITFFRAIRKAAKKHLGHDRFGFTINIETFYPKEDLETGLLFGAKIQEALTIAQQTVQPVVIEGTTVQ